MHCSRMFGVFVFASVAIVAAPASVMPQSTADELEQKAKGAADVVFLNHPASRGRVFQKLSAR